MKSGHHYGEIGQQRGDRPKGKQKALQRRVILKGTNMGQQSGASPQGKDTTGV